MCTGISDEEAEKGFLGKLRAALQSTRKLSIWTVIGGVSGYKGKIEK